MYTHDVKFRVGDGSMYLEAELGEDPSTKDIIYKLTGTSEPLRDDLLDEYLSFTSDVKRMMEKYKGIKEISIIKKD